MSIILFLIIAYFLYTFFFSRKSLFGLFSDSSRKQQDATYSRTDKVKKEDKAKAELFKDGEYVHFEEIDDKTDK